jgi:hypothetical protein
LLFVDFAGKCCHNLRLKRRDGLKPIDPEPAESSPADGQHAEPTSFGHRPGFEALIQGPQVHNIMPHKKIRSRSVRRLPIGLLMVLAGVMVAGGCFEEPRRQATKQSQAALDQALRDLALVDASRTVIMWGHDPSAEEMKTLPPKVRQSYQAAPKHLEALDKSIAALESAASANPDAAAVSQQLVAANAFAANMRLYQARLSIETYRRLNAGLWDRYTAIRMLAGELSADQSLLEEINRKGLLPAVEQTKATMAKMAMLRGIIDGQRTAVLAAQTALQNQLAATEKQRAELDTQIGTLTGKLSTMKAADAVELQKKINDMERQRFDLTKQVDRLRTGPFTLPQALVLDEGYSVQEIAGLHQLAEELKIVDGRLAAIDAGIKAQQIVLSGLDKQGELEGRQGQELAAAIDAKTKTLTQQVADLAAAVQQAETAKSKAEQSLAKAGKNAQAATTAAKAFVTAVNQASQNVAAGTVNEYLDAVKKVMNISAPTELLSAQIVMTKVELMGAARDQLALIQPVLDVPVTLPEPLATMKKEPATVLADQAKAIEEAVTSATATIDRVRKQARTPEETLIAGVALGSAYYRGAVVLPEKAAEYGPLAMAVVNELKQSRPDANDPMTMGYFRLAAALNIPTAATPTAAPQPGAPAIPAEALPAAGAAMPGMAPAAE